MGPFSVSGDVRVRRIRWYARPRPGAVSSVGRAPARQAGGRWFEPSTAHSHPTAGTSIRIPGAEVVRRTARRVNEVRQLEETMALMRRLLPGDPDFGDPLSTMGADPANVVARRAYQLADGR